jgi:hypothetical protein
VKGSKNRCLLSVETEIVSGEGCSSSKRYAFESCGEKFFGGSRSMLRGSSASPCCAAQLLRLLGNAEIKNLRLAAAGDEYICRFDVRVNDSFGVSVKNTRPPFRGGFFVGGVLSDKLYGPPPFGM